MGKGAYVKINNNTSRVCNISFSNTEQMYDHGKEGSSFGPISGDVDPGKALPHPGGWQYIERDQHLSWLLTPPPPGRFTMIITEKSTGRELAWVKFVCDAGRYSNRGQHSLPGALTIDITGGDQDEIVVTIRDFRPRPAGGTLVETLAGFLYWRVPAEPGVSHEVVDAIVADLTSRPQITDLVVIAHGMNNGPGSARNTYESYFEALRRSTKQKFDPDLAAIGLFGVIWPGDGTLPPVDKARTAGRALAAMIEELAERVPLKFRFHLAGHSTGTILALEAAYTILKRPGAPLVGSLFLLQSIADVMTEPFSTISPDVVKGPIAATCSDSDDVLRGFTVVSGFFGPGPATQTLGRNGFNSKKGVVKVKKDVFVSNDGWMSARFVSLDCSSIITGHNRFILDEVGWAHFQAISCARS